MQKCRAVQSALSPKAALPISAPVRAQPHIQRRNIQDVFITRTGSPIIKVQGGRVAPMATEGRGALANVGIVTRSSLGGHTATVFGATGFLGRYIVNRLARQGCTVIVPYREEMTKRHLKVTGDLGRVVFMEYDLRNTQSIEESVRHSDIVYNLIGRNYPTKNFSYEDIHVEGTERIVESVAKYDVDRYVHVSSYNASLDSPSEFFRTKAQGENVARSIFPETTIVRPAPMFGFEDRLLHRLAGVTNIFTSNHMQERYWPVHAIDVGRALEIMLMEDWTTAQTFELYGPKNYSTKEISELVDREIIKKRRHINVPKAIMKPAAYWLNRLLWWPITSADEVEREFIDQQIDPTAKTFKDLGIEPTDLNTLTFHYLLGYRSSQYADLPPATERELREERKYLHVLDSQ
ncbi:NADH-ubiquinone oxidoreductase 40 kDa subunit, mitochondrial [Trichophyton interdigitale MR816]|uniref:NADH-ubiquinone oxidoreductase 40 kDa subunit, mitochondrial n=1 Tax=Trichophyton interdigitale (strain MR816) TaxID=1215338 RepID=A0A059J219_TRIIM|nr:NADH-ubiquinone oxidoreductase 40 kDa subunit, mitochondrial [Trichophyton interdigitale MR816]